MLRTLLRLEFIRFWRQADRRSLGAKGAFWLLYWSTCILVMKLLFPSSFFSFMTSFAPAFVAFYCLGIMLPDFFLKLLLKRNATFMNNYIRSKPVPGNKWEQFLILSQLWDPFCLFMPALSIPICFGILPFFWGVLLLLAVYLISCFNGIVLMEFQKKKYDESRVSARSYTFSMPNSLNRWTLISLQAKGIIRSRRILIQLCVFPIFTIPQLLLHASANPSSILPFLFIILTLSVPVVTIGQLGFGIEKNYISYIFTRPVSLYKLVLSKYILISCCTLLFAAILLPICLFCSIPLIILLASTVYTIGVLNLILLWNSHTRSRFDLFGKAFFNYQGTEENFHLNEVISIIIFFTIPILIKFTFGYFDIEDTWLSIALCTLGLLGLCCSNFVFKHSVECLLQNKKTILQNEHPNYKST